LVARIQSAAVASRIQLDGKRIPLARIWIPVNDNRNLPAHHRIPVGGNWIRTQAKSG
jgi:hypothetical protein